MKSLLTASLLFFSNLSFASSLYSDSYSGFHDEKRLHVEIHNVCLNYKTRYWGPGPYHISASLFSELLFTEHDYSNRKTPYSRSHAIRSFDEFYKIGDFEHKLEGSLFYNKIIPKGVSFKNIEGLNFDIPMRDINSSVIDAAMPFETDFSFFPTPSQIGPKAIKIVGIEIGVYSKAHGTKVFSSKVAFPNPYENIGSNLRSISSKAFNGKTSTLYPRISVLNENFQHIKHIGNTHHFNPQKSFDCDGESGLDFSLEIL